MKRSSLYSTLSTLRNRLLFNYTRLLFHRTVANMVVFRVSNSPHSLTSDTRMGLSSFPSHSGLHILLIVVGSVPLS
ncbi:unnamed protein product [Auanema sp. JU1783]|nr:unnamed protein product [Auanema sp. JU1783]